MFYTQMRQMVAAAAKNRSHFVENGRPVIQNGRIFYNERRFRLQFSEVYFTLPPWRGGIVKVDHVIVHSNSPPRGVFGSENQNSVDNSPNRGVFSSNDQDEVDH